MNTYTTDITLFGKGYIKGYKWVTNRLQGLQLGYISNSNVTINVTTIQPVKTITCPKGYRGYI